MKCTNIFNPISGLSANQVIRLLEQGSSKCLSDNNRELAISTVADHIRYVPEATVKSTIYALFRVTSLRGFASTANQQFLGLDSELESLKAVV